MLSPFDIFLALLLASLTNALAPKNVTVNGVTYVSAVLTTGPSVQTYLYRWSNVPFAQPPTGENRWKPPIPLTAPPVPTTKLANAAPSNSCNGYSSNISTTVPTEDCLYLNIWAPSSAANSLPVVIFIPGGGLESAVVEDGTRFTYNSNSSIIFVSGSYRVGGFGFLASADIQSNGGLNAGYQDQRLLIQWVHANIAKFGGDPTRVTIAGDSAGGGSVNSQLTAFGGQNGSSSLIQGAIAMSPSFGSIRSVQNDTTASGRNDLQGSQYQYDALINATSCMSSSAQARFSCLQSVNTTTIYRLFTRLFTSPNFYATLPGQSYPPYFPFGPVLDGSFVSDLRYDSFNQENYLDVPMLMGNPTNDGGIFYGNQAASFSDFNLTITGNYASTQPSFITDLAQYYNTTSQIPASQAPTYNLEQAYGDLRYQCPTIIVGTIKAGQNNTNPSWLYHYAIPNAKGAVDHGSDRSALLGFNYSDPNSLPPYAGSNYYQSLNTMANLFTNFIIYGDPNGINPNYLWTSWTPEDSSGGGTTGQRLLIKTSTSMAALPEPLPESCDLDEIFAMFNRQ